MLPFLINKSHSDCIYVRLAALLSFPELGHALDIEHKTKVLVSYFLFILYCDGWQPLNLSISYFYLDSIKVFTYCN